ncbi:MAG TPA: tryptophan 7-halogenase, partial [Pseudomonadales bacterium]
ESTVELSSYYFANVLGLKDHLSRQQLPKLGLRFFFRSEKQLREQPLHEQIEFGARVFPHSPSYQLDRGIFENFLAEQAQQLGVHFVDGTKVTDIAIGKEDEGHRVHTLHLASEARNTYQCRYLVDACSRKSPVKRKLELAQDSQHKVSSAWFRIADKLDISEFSDNPQWRAMHEGDNSRWFSTNHLMGEGYWVWLIPLSSGSTSIGIVADNNYHPLESYNSIDKAMAWLEQHEPVAARHIRGQLDKLQDFRVLRNFSHDCKQVYSKDRWFLTGEAGVFLDPFYSPGSDFIAVSNTFVSNLIQADMAGDKGFATQCMMFNLIYLNMYQNTALIYQNQYAIFGNPRVMPVKILWDFSVYWTFLAFLFIQGTLNDASTFLGLRNYLDEVGNLNRIMQPFLLKWSELETSPASRTYIDPFEMPLLDSLNAGLYQANDAGQFRERFVANLQQLKTLAAQITSTACARHPQLAELRGELPEAGEPGNPIAALLARLDGSEQQAA